MKTVIIEDELLTAEELAATLLQLPDGVEIVKILSSVAEAVEFFQPRPLVDLIFCDIQLGDGHSFEIFKRVKVEAPVIFCTAYDQYALEAFQNNGIDYILKPFSKKLIRGAVEKYNALRHRLGNTVIDYDNLLRSLQTGYQHDKKISSLLVNYKDKIIPVKIADIALIGIEHKMAQVITFGQQKYYVNHTLEELEAMCGPQFYRANRQYLINRDAVQEALQYFARKLVLKLKIEGKYEIIISKTKVPEFLSWLRG